MELELLKNELRSYPGITRKQLICNIIDYFPDVELPEGTGVIEAAWGEDCAVLDLKGPHHILFAADGIMKQLIKADPFWAGYCSVLVNIHDIVSMGGLPIAMVNIISVANREEINKVLEGIKSAVEKFGVPMVGGHTHPEESENSISVAILGLAERGHVIYSGSASPGDDIISAMDLDGKIHPVFNYSWDTTRHKSSEQVWKQLNSMRKIAEKDLATAGKDISNPGIIGTLGMLAEYSGAGAELNISEIPAPADIDLIRWLKMYQGMGFVITSRPENTGEVLNIFSKSGLTAARIGQMNSSSKLIVSSGSESIDLFDFNVDSITGIKSAGK